MLIDVDRKFKSALRFRYITIYDYGTICQIFTCHIRCQLLQRYEIIRGMDSLFGLFCCRVAVGGVAAELGGGDARHGAAGSEAAEGTGGDGGQGGASVGHYFGARREFGQRGGGSGAVLSYRTSPHSTVNALRPACILNPSNSVGLKS